jgi:hypothetical protein
VDRMPHAEIPRSNSSSPDLATSANYEALHNSHHTLGYRNGILESKQSTLQPAFDTAYSTGAILGLKAGKILGELEGIQAAGGEDPEVVALKEDVNSWIGDLEDMFPDDGGRGTDGGIADAERKLLYFDERVQILYRRLGLTLETTVNASVEQASPG